CDFIPQGIGADLIGSIDGYSCADVDQFAEQSEKKAGAAEAKCYFNKSIIPGNDKAGVVIREQDEFIKPNTTAEALSTLNPSFAMMGQMGFDAIALQKYPEVGSIQHVHHAGNSSGIVDGAAVVLVASEQAVQQHN